MRLRSVWHEGSHIIWIYIQVIIPLIFIWSIERRWCNLLELESILPVLVKNPLETINQVFVIFITVKHIKTRQNELVLVVDQEVQKINIILVFEVVPGKAVHELKQLLLVLGNWRHWSVHPSHDLLSVSYQSGTQFLVFNGSGKVAIDQSEDINVLLKN